MRAGLASKSDIGPPCCRARCASAELQFRRRDPTKLAVPGTLPDKPEGFIREATQRLSRIILANVDSQSRR